MVHFHLSIPRRVVAIIACVSLAGLAACSEERRPAAAALDLANRRLAANPISGWRLAPGIRPAAMQAARERSFRFCATVRPGQPDCLEQQDRSLSSWSHAILVHQAFLRGPPRDGFPEGHRLDPDAFARVQRECWAIYADNGHGDARMLGPCAMSALGGDHFGIIPVP